MQNNRRLSKPATTLAAAGLVTAFLTAGCSLQDSVCRSEEYPVKAVGSTTGQTCVADGEEPPKGYVRYPEGKVPEHVDDKWDKYWSTRVIDKDSNVTKK
ncbi:SCO0607 family lipoprotein [Streptomyces albidus (ex Kaewkla and Franco 2022)]|uniref:SCO0607 family lipoprotein n=1 Tax=Streptomyces albidus (ex Kaewkla and Franco 2022) TaxID=722709 RepID=UPI003AF31B74